MGIEAGVGVAFRIGVGVDVGVGVFVGKGIGVEFFQSFCAELLLYLSNDCCFGTTRSTIHHLLNLSDVDPESYNK